MVQCFCPPVNVAKSTYWERPSAVPKFIAWPVGTLIGQVYVFHGTNGTGGGHSAGVEWARTTRGTVKVEVVFHCLIT